MLLCYELQGLECAHARVWADAGAAVPEPDVTVTDVVARFPGDREGVSEFIRVRFNGRSVRPSNAVVFVVFLDVERGCKVDEEAGVIGPSTRRKTTTSDSTDGTRNTRSRSRATSQPPASVGASRSGTSALMVGFV